MSAPGAGVLVLLLHRADADKSRWHVIELLVASVGIQPRKKDQAAPSGGFLPVAAGPPQPRNLIRALARSGVR
jgi:hypothetical protein